jgi:hypothetical protein
VIPSNWSKDHASFAISAMGSFFLMTLIVLGEAFFLVVTFFAIEVFFSCEMQI